MHSGKITFASGVVLALLLVFQINSIVVAQKLTQRTTGHVRDEAGAAVQGVAVEFDDGHRVLRVTTGADGEFSFAGPALRGVLKVFAPGFAVFSRVLDPDQSTADLDITLAPATIQEQVTVTATRTATLLDSTAASVRVVADRDLAVTAAPTIDDALRQVPGFQLFRRNGSRTANPTSQGVSLRGVGASGASRALVLADGVPFADPFGGWVYWDRLPLVALDRIEVVRGGASDLYGSNAMGGVINILTRETEMPALAVETSYGNEKSFGTSIFGGAVFKKFTSDLAGEIFQTDGYINVEKNQRGAVDTPVASRHRSVYLELGYNRNKSIRFFLKPSYFRESRNNGTPLQTNRTHIAEIDGGADWSYKTIGDLSFRGYLSRSVYDQTFSSIAPPRNSENLIRVQRVPAQSAGLMFQWARRFSDRQDLVGGLEAREVRGSSDEIVFDRGNVSSLVGAGGRQRSYSLFLRDSLKLFAGLSFSAGARIDWFQNLDGLSVTRGISPPALDKISRFADHSEQAVSPELSILYSANQKLSFFASIYQSFRAPTLNELYRSFRVGNVLTLANANLQRERATGGEAGARLSLLKDRVYVRTSFFATRISDPIANVTVAGTSALITRQRQNLGRTRSVGLEVDSNVRFNARWNVSAGYLLANATVIRFPSNPALENLFIPQTPRHSFTLQLTYNSPRRYRFGLQGRALSSQFEDDQNLLPLRSFFTVDSYASRIVARRLEIFVAGENLLNTRYDVGRTPVLTIGPPRQLRVGLKIRLGRER